MNYDMMNNNRLSLTGTISSPVTFTHEVLGESFFETTIEVKRLSGMTEVSETHLNLVSKELPYKKYSR